MIKLSHLNFAPMSDNLCNFFRRFRIEGTRSMEQKKEGRQAREKQEKREQR